MNLLFMALVALLVVSGCSRPKETKTAVIPTPTPKPIATPVTYPTPTAAQLEALTYNGTSTPVTIPTPVVVASPSVTNQPAPSTNTAPNRGPAYPSRSPRQAPTQPPPVRLWTPPPQVVVSPEAKYQKLADDIFEVASIIENASSHNAYGLRNLSDDCYSQAALIRKFRTPINADSIDSLATAYNLLARAAFNKAYFSNSTYQPNGAQVHGLCNQARQKAKHALGFAKHEAN